jgi:glycosyltransferase involved in cell wall biosynthesis
MEARLLEDHGHEVIRYEVSNDAVSDYGKIGAAQAAFWNRRTYDAVAGVIAATDPDVAHFHNTFPLMSPSAYDACAAAGVPVVQTLHNYRLLCAAGTLFRGGRPCEVCLTRSVKWPGVMHACYRDDRLASAVTVGSLAYHHARGTYQRRVARFIAVSEFTKQKFVESGLAADRIVVKQNGVPDPGIGPGGPYALFVGRLAPEKGIATMLRAWKDLGGSVHLKIVGDGPERPAVAEAAASFEGIEYMGRKDSGEVAQLMRHAAFLVFPSEWYETFGLTIVEAYACGTPVVAAGIGAAAELVEDGVTGALFTPGDAAGLQHAALGLMASDREDLRRHARRKYERDFTPERSMERLMNVYHSVMAAC